LNVAGINGGAATTPAAQAERWGGMNPPILPRVTSTPLADGTVYHLVGYGQTLGTIAGMYGVTVQQLVDRNNVDPDRIYAGQKLWIMKVNTPTTPPTELPSLTTIPTESLTATSHWNRISP
jgi:LysM repeat protein